MGEVLPQSHWASYALGLGERVRAIRLMRGLCDDVSIDGRPDGTTVCLLFRDCPVKDERFAGSAVRQ